MPLQQGNPLPDLNDFLPDENETAEQQQGGAANPQPQGVNLPPLPNFNRQRLYDLLYIDNWNDRAKQLWEQNQAAADAYGWYSFPSAGAQGRGYWEDPRVLFRYKSVIDAGGELPAWVNSAAIESAYAYLDWYNDGAEWTDWEMPATNDPMSQVLHSLPLPPEEFLQEDEQHWLNANVQNQPIPQTSTQNIPTVVKPPDPETPQSGPPYREGNTPEGTGANGVIPLTVGVGNLPDSQPSPSLAPGIPYAEGYEPPREEVDIDWSQVTLGNIDHEQITQQMMKDLDVDRAFVYEHVYGYDRKSFSELPVYQQLLLSLTNPQAAVKDRPEWSKIAASISMGALSGAGIGQTFGKANPLLGILMGFTVAAGETALNITDTELPFYNGVIGLFDMGERFTKIYSGLAKQAFANGVGQGNLWNGIKDIVQNYPEAMAVTDKTYTVKEKNVLNFLAPRAAYLETMIDYYLAKGYNFEHATTLAQRAFEEAIVEEGEAYQFSSGFSESLPMLDEEMNVKTENLYGGAALNELREKIDTTLWDSFVWFLTGITPKGAEMAFADFDEMYGDSGQINDLVNSTLFEFDNIREFGLKGASIGAKLLGYPELSAGLHAAAEYDYTDAWRDYNHWKNTHTAASGDGHVIDGDSSPSSPAQQELEVTDQYISGTEPQMDGDSTLDDASRPDSTVDRDADTVHRAEDGQSDHLGEDFQHSDGQQQRVELDEDGRVPQQTEPGATAGEGSAAQPGGMENYFDYFSQQTPDTKAAIAINNLVRDLGTMVVDADNPAMNDFQRASGFVNVLEQAGTVDVVSMGQIGKTAANSPTLATAAGLFQQALKDGGVQELYTQFTADQRRITMLNQMAAAMEMNPSRLVEAAARDPQGTFVQLVGVLEQKAQNGNAGAQQLMSQVQSGVLSLDSFRDQLAPFTGVDSRGNVVDVHPWTFEEFRANTLMKVEDAAMHAIADHYGISMDGALARFADTLKAAQSMLLLEMNPAYLVNTQIANWITTSMEGVYGVFTLDQANAWLDRFDIGASLDAARLDSPLDRAMSAAVLDGDALALRKAVSQTAHKFGLLNDLTASMKAVEGQRAYVLGMKKAWDGLWKEGLGFEKMPPALENQLSAIDPDLPEKLYAGVRGALNTEEINAIIAEGVDGISVNRAVSAAANQLAAVLEDGTLDGNLDSTAGLEELLTDVGLDVQLRDRLADVNTPEQVQLGVRAVVRDLRDHIQLEKQQRLQTWGDEVSQLVAQRGYPGVMQSMTEMLMRQADTRFESLVKLAELRNLDGVDGNAAFDAYFTDQQSAFAADAAQWTAALDGIQRSCRADSPLTQQVVGWVNDIQTHWQEAIFGVDFLLEQPDRRATLSEVQDAGVQTTHVNGVLDWARLYFESGLQGEARQALWTTVQERMNGLLAEAWDNETRVQGLMDTTFADNWLMEFGTGREAQAWRDGANAVRQNLAFETDQFIQQVFDQGLTGDDLQLALARFVEQTAEPLKRNVDINFDFELYEGALKTGENGQGNSSHGGDSPPTPPVTSLEPVDGLTAQLTAQALSQDARKVTADAHTVYQGQLNRQIVLEKLQRNFALDAQQMEAVRVLMDLYAEQWARERGRLPEEWYGETFADITGEGNPEVVGQVNTHIERGDVLTDTTTTLGATSPMLEQSAASTGGRFDNESIASGNGEINSTENAGAGSGVDQISFVEDAFGQYARRFQMTDSAVDFLHRIDEAGAPAHITAEMRRLAQENGIPLPDSSGANGVQVLLTAFTEQQIRADKAAEILNILDQDAEQVALQDFSYEAWREEFNRPIQPIYGIDSITISENVIRHLQANRNQYRLRFFKWVRPALERASFVLREPNGALVYVKAFIDPEKKVPFKVVVKVNKAGEIYLATYTHLKVNQLLTKMIDEGLLVYPESGSPKLALQGSTSPSLEQGPLIASGRVDIKSITFADDVFNSSRARGAVSFLEDGRAILRASAAADVTTVVHELGHIFRRQLTEEQLQTFADWVGADPQEIQRLQDVFDSSSRDSLDALRESDPQGVADVERYVDWEEQFARGFERFLAEEEALEHNTSPESSLPPLTAGIRNIFRQFAAWIKDVYRHIKGSPLDVILNDGMRELYRQILGLEFEDSGHFAAVESARAGFAHHNVEKGNVWAQGAQAFTTLVEEMWDRPTLYLPPLVEAAEGVSLPTALFAEALGLHYDPKTNVLNRPLAALDEEGNQPTFGEYVEGVVAESPASLDAEDWKSALLAETGEAPAMEAAPVETSVPQGYRVNENLFSAEGFIIERVWQEVHAGEDVVWVPRYEADGGAFALSEKFYRTPLDSHPRKAIVIGVKPDDPSRWALLTENGQVIYLPKATGQSVLFQTTDALKQHELLAGKGWIKGAQAMPLSTAQENLLQAKLQPLLGLMESSMIQQLNEPHRAFSELPLGMQSRLNGWLAQTVVPAMNGTRLAAKRKGESLRQAVEMNYQRQYNAEMGLVESIPYALWYTSPMLGWAQGNLDAERWGAMFSRQRHLHKKVEERIPARLRGKLQSNAPYLPEWAGNLGYRDPLGEFTPQFLDTEEHRPDASTGFSAHGVAARMLGVDPSALELSAQRGSGLTLSKMEQVAQDNFDLAAFTAWGDYYIDRQLANRAAHNPMLVDAVQEAMITRQGRMYNEAYARVQGEMAYQVPGVLQAEAIRSALRGESTGLDALASFYHGLFPTTLVGEGELKLEGLTDAYNEAWKQHCAGDADALNDFFREHPEYQVRLALYQEPEERLRQYLVRDIWELWSQVEGPNKDIIAGQLPGFEDGFLEESTRDYTAFSPQQLANLDATLRTVLTTLDNAVVDQSGGLAQELEGLYPPEVNAAVADYWREKHEQWPNIEQLEQWYYTHGMPEGAEPMLEAFWAWRDDYYDEHPEIEQYEDVEEMNRLYEEYPKPMANEIVHYLTEGEQRWAGAAVEQMQEDYFDRKAHSLPSARAYLREHPILAVYWQWQANWRAQSSGVRLYLDRYGLTGETGNPFTDGGAQNGQTPYLTTAQLNAISPSALTAVSLAYHGAGTLGEGTRTLLRCYWEEQGRPGGSFEEYVEEVLRMTS